MPRRPAHASCQGLPPAGPEAAGAATPWGTAGACVKSGALGGMGAAGSGASMGLDSAGLDVHGEAGTGGSRWWVGCPLGVGWRLGGIAIVGDSVIVCLSTVRSMLCFGALPCLVLVPRLDDLYL